MKLYIDGDAFPNLLKPIVLKAINKRELETIVVSNKRVFIGESSHISYIIVAQGMDMADKHIEDLAYDNDLVITADIPLADKVIHKKAYALDHRGTLYTDENIKQYLAMRNLMDEIRSSGEMTRGPAPFSKKDVYEFSNGLQKILTKIAY